MGLKTYNTLNVRRNRQPMTPCLMLYRKQGIIMFNSTAQELMKLKAGDHVQFHQDEDEPSEWYVQKTKGKEGFRLRLTSRNNYLALNSSFMVQTIYDSVNYTGINGKIIIGDKIQDYGDMWTLVTLVLRNQ
jgi:hypothetical protein